jgi:hypothetical protein
MDANLSDVIQPFSQSASSNGWFEVDLSGYNVNVRGDFYIAMEWLTDYYPHLGVDGTSPHGRSFEWNGTAWLARSQDYMVRAVVESVVPIRPIGIIDCIPLSSYVTGGRNVTVSGSIAPISVGVEVDVTYMRPDGSTVVRKALTNTTGEFADTFMPDKVGLWKAMASWSGNEDYEGSTSFPEEFTVSMGTAYIHLSYFYPNRITIGSAINLTGSVSPGRLASIDLEYSLDQAQTWNTFASVNTTGDGEYSYLWTPVSVGTYVVRAVWRGDEVCTGSNSTGAMLNVEETKKSFRTYVDWRGFDIEVACNSTVSDFVFDQAQKMISFQLTGISQTVGYCNVSFPKELLGGPYDVQVGDLPIVHYETSNGQMLLHFTFNFQSTCNVKIVGQTVIPEFPSIALPVFMIAALFAVILRACVQRSNRQSPCALRSNHT